MKNFQEKLLKLIAMVLLALMLVIPVLYHMFK